MYKTGGELIEHNVRIVDENNTPITVNYHISKRGRGDVYHVTYKGTDYALMWYCQNDVIDDAQYMTISIKCGEKRMPSDRFLWPLFMVTEENSARGKRFGYLMRLMPSGYRKMGDFLRGDDDPTAVRFTSYHAMLMAGMGIVKVVQDLHMRGWSCKDLNPDNFVINPKTGDILVVNDDNVFVDGELCTAKGRSGYMAPEIPRSEYKLNPSIATDRYSLAVVLYLLFFNDHPMEGKQWQDYPIITEQLEDYLYCINPVFHYDPKDDSNRPVPEITPNVEARWNSKTLYSEEMRETFIRAFTEGIDNPGKRPTELEWMSVLAKTRDRLIRFPDGREQFDDFNNLRSIPPRMLGVKIGSKMIALYPGKDIYEFSLTGDTRQYAKVSADVVYDKNQDCFALRNLTDQIWHCRSPKTGQTVIIGKGEDFPLEPHAMIGIKRENPTIIGEIFDPRG